MMSGHHPMQLVVGAGQTGMSFLRYLQRKDLPARLYDDHLNIGRHHEITSQFSSVAVMDSHNEISETLHNVGRILLSPGIDLMHPLVRAAKEKDVEIVGDIEIFSRHDARPVIAITGSNAKSTVVTLVGLMAKADGRNVAVGGNIGTPVLDLLDGDFDLFVFELSSFQLDTTSSLKTKVACILNITPDHLDRYDSFDAYVSSKQTIYNNCEFVVFNRKDALTIPSNKQQRNGTSFGLDEPGKNEFGVRVYAGEKFLCHDEQRIMSVNELPNGASHNIENALAALAIGFCAGFDFAAMKTVLSTFAGLPHRCEFVADVEGIRWVNDSKGTNIGACIAAIQSLSQGKNIILIAGGDSKGADLQLLADILKAQVKCLCLIGRDATLFFELFKDVLPCQIFKSMDEAVNFSRSMARSGDVVLLSPACSSLDMYKNYMERGEHFRCLVSTALSQAGGQNG